MTLALYLSINSSIIDMVDVSIVATAAADASGATVVVVVVVVVVVIATEHKPPTSPVEYCMHSASPLENMPSLKLNVISAPTSR